MNFLERYLIRILSLKKFNGLEGLRSLDLTLRKRSHCPSCATSPIDSLVQIFKNVWKNEKPEVYASDSAFFTKT